MSVSTRWIDIPAGNDSFGAYVALPAGGNKGPGIVIVQEIFGVNGHIRDVVEQYALDGKQLDALMAAGLEAESTAVDYFRFTSDLKRHLDTEQRLELIGILWDIVYADGERSEMEDHVIWRIADLLGVSSRERIQKRQEAAARVTDAQVVQDDAD